MHVNNSLILLRLLSLYIDFLRGGVGEFFLQLRARYNKRGGQRARRYQSFKKRNNDQGFQQYTSHSSRSYRTATCPKLTRYSDIPLQQQELQDCCKFYINQHHNQVLDAKFFSFLFFPFYKGIKPKGRLFWKGGVI